MFDNEALNEFLTALFSAPGKTNDFRKLDCQLAIVAVDLDTGQAVRFGTIGRRHIPISKAVQASAALPGLYPPVEIENRYFVDGALRRTLHASVALDAGADIVFAINPLVPFDAEQARRKTGRRTKKLSSGGLPCRAFADIPVIDPISHANRNRESTKACTKTPTWSCWSPTGMTPRCSLPMC